MRSWFSISSSGEGVHHSRRPFGRAISSSAMARGLGPGALVVAEAPDDAPFHHHGTLRALFAGDHARGPTRRGAAELLDLGPNRVERHPHQRRGDFRLRFLVVGDADRREDRLVQRRRIVPHSPRPVFGVPICTHWGPWCPESEVRIIPQRPLERTPGSKGHQKGLVFVWLRFRNSLVRARSDTERMSEPPYKYDAG